MSEPQAPPKLSVVEPSAPSDAAPASGTGESARKRSRWTWLALAVAVVFALLWLGQRQRANELDGQVAALSSELAGARTELAAFETLVGEARTRVRGLAADLASLGSLLGEDAASSDEPFDARLGEAFEPAPLAEGAPAEPVAAD